ncbi:MAG: DUF58 domain-containing protein [Candidatus Pacearchaeota archaeon]
MERKLNINIPEAAFRFETLIERILPKRIFYKLLLRGKGLEFDGYRDFAPDDDFSIIDWKASIRANKYLTKQYVEERDIKIIFVIDVSDNMIFGSGKKLKCEHVAEIAGALGRVLLNDPRDQFGYLFYSDDIVDMRMPEPGMKQYERFVYQLSNPNIYGGKGNLKNALTKLMERIDSSISLIVIISDFLKIERSALEILENVTALIETIAIIVKDPLDFTFPEVDREVVIENPETGERLLINPKLAKSVYEHISKIKEKKVRRLLREAGVDNVKIVTNKDFCPRLAFFLKRRTTRRE